MQRINTFLAEADVPDWACSLTRPINTQNGHETSENIGFENATLEWHRMEQGKTTTTVTASSAQIIEDEDRHPRLDTGEPIPSSSDQGAPIMIGISTDLPPTSNGNIRNVGTTPIKAFKLQNLNVSLPPGELTLVTGITGAGKTAFLVALLGGKHQAIFLGF